MSALSIRDAMIKRGETPCKSCPHDFPMPATYIAHPKMTDGTQGGDWPVCREHMQWAMMAGWFPIDEIGADQ